ncbi:hypothetical protein PIB30_088893 [Stylosanthes scabra]|uniref:Uncharacterized protein n=1 Tax=Stylosanthes scabra TaxID=79078 RepID=A0ABU6TW50_9FABA|nr:hypothetical protein [Stylosanthes scabra]
MAHTKSNPLAKEKKKAHRPPRRASPRLAALQSQGKVQPQLQAPDVPAENIHMPILPPKKRLTYQMAGEGSSSKRYKTSMQTIPTDRRTAPCQEPSDGNLEADAEGALPAAEGAAEEILPKNDVYDAL